MSCSKSVGFPIENSRRLYMKKALRAEKTNSDCNLHQKRLTFVTEEVASKQTIDKQHHSHFLSDKMHLKNRNVMRRAWEHTDDEFSKNLVKARRSGERDLRCLKRYKKKLFAPRRCHCQPDAVVRCFPRSQ